MKKIFTLVGLVSTFALSNAQIVINEIYTGGGLLTAVLANDFIELKNIGSTTQTLTGATIQYGPLSGQFTQYHTLPSITLNAGQTYLIQQASDGLGGINLLNPNLIVNVVLNLDGSGPVVGVGLQLGLTSGKVALASNNTRVTGPTASNVIDFVGYGLADQYEGTGAAPSPTFLNSIARISGDTNRNNVDFTAAFPTPQSTGQTLAVGDVNGSNSVFIKNTLVKNNEIIFGNDVQNVQIYSMSGQLVKSNNAKDLTKINIADLPKGNYIVTGTVNDKKVSERIIKD
ncbi:lamin tail domain-containing protein [Epilithonimonas sp. JDS]|uniref:T9SS type A sorting domain-containing protein n=1 Tax=Epilithonimonas sp. JDS TaxID=2902797 RepID=UPI001E3931E7|nr:T9SS type A sorting domain-containing protein [Epilithonimonas sp. JDS]MCD9856019.1 lamin tail domain-containing protein [Epilithonimonas sp. JDS]